MNSRNDIYSRLFIQTKLQKTGFKLSAAVSDKHKFEVVFEWHFYMAERGNQYFQDDRYKTANFFEYIKNDDFLNR